MQYHDSSSSSAASSKQPHFPVQITISTRVSISTRRAQRAALILLGGETALTCLLTGWGLTLIRFSTTTFAYLSIAHCIFLIGWAPFIWVECTARTLGRTAAGGKEQRETEHTETYRRRTTDWDEWNMNDYACTEPALSSSLHSSRSSTQSTAH